MEGNHQIREQRGSSRALSAIPDRGQVVLSALATNARVIDVVSRARLVVR